MKYTYTPDYSVLHAFPAKPMEKTAASPEDLQFLRDLEGIPPALSKLAQAIKEAGPIGDIINAAGAEAKLGPKAIQSARGEMAKKIRHIRNTGGGLPAQWDNRKGMPVGMHAHIPEHGVSTHAFATVPGKSFRGTPDDIAMELKQRAAAKAKEAPVLAKAAELYKEALTPKMVDIAQRGALARAGVKLEAGAKLPHGGLADAYATLHPETVSLLKNHKNIRQQTRSIDPNILKRMGNRRITRLGRAFPKGMAPLSPADAHMRLMNATNNIPQEDRAISDFVRNADKAVRKVSPPVPAQVPSPVSGNLAKAASEKTSATLKRLLQGASNGVAARMAAIPEHARPSIEALLEGNIKGTLKARGFKDVGRFTEKLEQKAEAGRSFLGTKARGTKGLKDQDRKGMRDSIRAMSEVLPKIRPQKAPPRPPLSIVPQIHSAPMRPEVGPTSMARKATPPNIRVVTPPGTGEAVRPSPDVFSNDETKFIFNRGKAKGSGKGKSKGKSKGKDKDKGSGKENKRLRKFKYDGGTASESGALPSWVGPTAVASGGIGLGGMVFSGSQGDY